MGVKTIAPNMRPLKKLRVCAYCRVSTDEVEQANSLENQIAHYEHLIKSDPVYEFAGIYHDYGISGFKEERPGFQEMLDAARAHKMDLIMTKSVSRFCRNTDTLLKTVRELKGLGIGIFFELQNIDTLSGSGEVLLTVLAAFAQAESDDYSTLAKMVYARKYASGYPIHYLERSYGYALNEDGEIILDPEEAPWIKKIFELSADGYNLGQIARYLNDQGIRTKKGADFTPNTILSILNNEIYKGDYIMHKYFVNDERREVVNRGEADAWYIKDDHVPIVSRKLWDKAQKTLEEKRAYLATRPVIAELNKDNYPYMDKIFCADCGHPLYRRVYSNGNRVSWGCSGQRRYTKRFCKGINVPDDILRGWGDISGNIYIRSRTDGLGKKTFRYVRESTWRRDHKVKMAPRSLTTEDHPYKDRLYCAECGSKLIKYVCSTNGRLFWICTKMKHEGKSACRGVRVPDDIVRGLPTTGDIYISRKEYKDGKRGNCHTS